jgi:hypothetical protein
MPNYIAQLSQWRTETGRVDRFYDIDENEVDEGDPRAFAGHFWKYSHYECVAQCNDNNCVCGVDPDVYPNHVEECDRREKLLRKALNKKYLVQAVNVAKTTEAILTEEYCYLLAAATFAPLLGTGLPNADAGD